MSASDRDEETNEPRPIVPEVPMAVSPYIRRVVADNAGPMTGPGTNTYLAGVDEIAVVDPGPDTDAHLEAVAGCGGDQVRWILLTTPTPDHAAGAARLAARTGATICAFDDAGDVPVERALADDDVLEMSEFRIRVVHTPGVAPDHLCFFLEEERTLFSGDQVLDGTTAAVVPPAGDMTAYLASLDKIRDLKRLKAIAPGHGYIITDPLSRIDRYVEHRLAREEQIVETLRHTGGTTIDDLVRRLYPELDGELVTAARHTVHAHLRRLAEAGSAAGDGLDGTWSSTA